VKHAVFSVVSTITISSTAWNLSAPPCEKFGLAVGGSSLDPTPENAVYRTSRHKRGSLQTG
jgi:hypothetical protein